jgi:hypothetical protein
VWVVGSPVQRTLGSANNWKDESEYSIPITSISEGFNSHLGAPRDQFGGLDSTMGAGFSARLTSHFTFGTRDMEQQSLTYLRAVADGRTPRSFCALRGSARTEIRSC